ncbi:hypothetical protein D1007_59451 [Hordeum vulgare]|nr:hypothetical protein D1007_59451 [Hordeum vulgare]
MVVITKGTDGCFGSETVVITKGTDGCFGSETVTLQEWWLVRLNGEERKLAVSGFTEKNGLFTSAPIAQRYESLTLQDKDGVVVLLYGSFSLLRMRENGFSMQA